MSNFDHATSENFDVVLRDLARRFASVIGATGPVVVTFELNEEIVEGRQFSVRMTGRTDGYGREDSRKISMHVSGSGVGVVVTKAVSNLADAAAQLADHAERAKAAAGPRA
jgi:hypothetical protein